MNALSYFLIYPWIYLIASLPFPALYRVSDFVSFVLRTAGYRREVILTNLRKSFPEKDDSDIRRLSSEYYGYLADLVLETFKTMKMTDQETRERVRYEKTEGLEQLRKENRSVIMIMGHFGNWEWVGPGIMLNSGFQLAVIYRPLSNPYFEKMLGKMRTRSGLHMTSANQTLRYMVASRDTLTATAFVADQANPGKAYWTTFLNQVTSVYTGPEKLAIKFNYPVVYLHVSRPRRGYYSIRPEIIFQEPKNTAPNEISEAFTKLLEKDIIANAPIWLWSHKRWKYQPPSAQSKSNENQNTET